MRSTTGICQQIRVPHLDPALKDGLITMTLPSTPRSHRQQYTPADRVRVRIAQRTAGTSPPEFTLQVNS